MLIGLTGYARTGKDTIADFMVSDYDFVKLSFADPMREALAKLDPTLALGDGHYARLSQLLATFTWDELKVISPDIRPLLQRFGTEVGRNMFGPNFWVDLAMAKASSHEDVVFADVRFKNEADAIREAGGILLRVSRPGFGPANDHISEKDMEDYDVDYHLGNTADLASLSHKVNVLIAATRAWA